jgi:hypothetical protein
MVHNCRRPTTMRTNLNAPQHSGRWRSGPQAKFHPSAQVDSAYCRRPKPANFEPNSCGSAKWRSTLSRTRRVSRSILQPSMTRANRNTAGTCSWSSRARPRLVFLGCPLHIAATVHPKLCLRALLDRSTDRFAARALGSPLDVRQACQDPLSVQFGPAFSSWTPAVRLPSGRPAGLDLLQCISDGQHRRIRRHLCERLLRTQCGMAHASLESADTGGAHHWPLLPFGRSARTATIKIVGRTSSRSSGPIDGRAAADRAMPAAVKRMRMASTKTQFDS